MEARIDGVTLFYLAVGPEENHPLFLLHGGPGFDHTELHPWLDPLADTFRLIYVDLRGQGRSQRVDPSTLSLDVMAGDIDKLAEALGLERYAVLGHSFGAFVTLAHAVERGSATHYILSSGTASFAKTGPEVEENLDRFEPVELREQVKESWALEPQVKTQEDMHRLWLMQLPFHFYTVESEAYRRYREELEQEDNAVYSPEVLAYVSAHGYPIEYEDRLSSVSSPTLVITGEHDRVTTPRAARDLHAGIPGSELFLVPDAAHMTHVEQPTIYMDAVRAFYRRTAS